MGRGGNEGDEELDAPIDTFTPPDPAAIMHAFLAPTHRYESDPDPTPQELRALMETLLELFSRPQLVDLVAAATPADAAVLNLSDLTRKVAEEAALHKALTAAIYALESPLHSLKAAVLEYPKTRTALIQSLKDRNQQLMKEGNRKLLEGAATFTDLLTGSLVLPDDFPLAQIPCITPTALSIRPGWDWVRDFDSKPVPPATQAAVTRLEEEGTVASLLDALRLPHVRFINPNDRGYGFVSANLPKRPRSAGGRLLYVRYTTNSAKRFTDSDDVLIPREPLAVAVADFLRSQAAASRTP